MAFCIITKEFPYNYNYTISQTFEEKKNDFTVKILLHQK